MLTDQSVKMPYRNQVVKINGFPIGIAIPSPNTKVDEGVEYTLCSFNNNDFSMWIPTYVLDAGNERLSH